MSIGDPNEGHWVQSKTNIQSFETGLQQVDKEK